MQTDLKSEQMNRTRPALVSLGLFAFGFLASTVATAAAPAPVAQNAAPPAGQDEAGARLTLEREEVTLNVLAPELRDPTEPKLAAGRDVRWDQVSLRVRSEGPEQIRADLAELLNYTWVPEGSGKTLRAGARAQALERELRRRWFATTIDQFLQYARLTKEPPQSYARLKAAVNRKILKRDELPKLLQNDGNVEFLSRTTLRPLLMLPHTLSPDQLFELASVGEERGLYLRWSQMSQQQREMALRVADQMPPGRRWVQEMGLRLRLHPYPGTPHPHTYSGSMANSNLAAGFAMFGSDVLEEQPPAGLPRGYPYTARDRPADSAGSVAKKQIASRYRELEEMQFPARGFRQAYPSTWPEAFRQLGERLPYSLYSDYFAAEPLGQDPRVFIGRSEGDDNPPVIALQRMTLAEGLDALCARYHKIWWRTGNALFFRSRTWFLDRPRQVPTPVLEELQQQWSTRGRLDQRGVDLLAGLSQEQLLGLAYLAMEKRKRSLSTELLANMGWFVPFFAALAPEQKEKLLGGGLSLAQMTPMQRDRYRQALFLSGRVAPDRLDSPPPFRIEQSVEPGVPGKEPAVGVVEIYLLDDLVTGPWARQMLTLARAYVPFREREPDRK